jgi:hypothetical protein
VIRMSAVCRFVSACTVNLGYVVTGRARLRRITDVNVSRLNVSVDCPAFISLIFSGQIPQSGLS